MRANSLLAMTLGGSLLLAGCGGETAPAEPQRPMTVESLEQTGKLRTISRGGTTFLLTVATDNPSAEQLRAMDEKVADYQYPEGPYDEEATLLSGTPQRIDVQVALHGKGSDRLSNDAACDTLRVPPEATQIGGLAIGGEENGVFISWPELDGGYSRAYVCSFQNREPNPSDGVVLYATSSS